MRAAPNVRIVLAVGNWPRSAVYPCTGSRYCFPVNVGCTDRGTVYQHGGRTNEHVDSSLIG